MAGANIWSDSGFLREANWPAQSSHCGREMGRTGDTSQVRGPRRTLSICQRTFFFPFSLFYRVKPVQVEKSSFWRLRDRVVVRGQGVTVALATPSTVHDLMGSLSFVGHLLQGHTDLGLWNSLQALVEERPE